MDTNELISIIDKSELIPSVDEIKTNDNWQVQSKFLRITIEKGAVLEQGGETKNVKETIVDNIWTTFDETKLDKLAKDVYKLGELI